MRYALALVIVTLVLVGCGSSQPASPSHAPTATPGATARTVTCMLDLHFADSISGSDVSSRQVTVTGSGADQQWSVDAMAGDQPVRVGWSRHSVSLYAPGRFAGGSVSNPAGLTVSADGKLATFTGITVTATVGGTASVSGTVSCSG